MKRPAADTMHQEATAAVLAIAAGTCDSIAVVRRRWRGLKFVKTDAADEALANAAAKPDAADEIPDISPTGVAATSGAVRKSAAAEQDMKAAPGHRDVSVARPERRRWRFLRPVKLESDASYSGETAAENELSTLSFCDVVASAVLAARDFPARVLAMLASQVPQVMVMPEAQRHGFEVRMIGMLAKILASEEDRARREVQCAQHRLGESAKEKAAAEASWLAAAGERAAREESTQATRAALAEQAAASVSARAALAAAIGEERAEEAEINATTAQCRGLAAVLKEAFVPLREGTFNSPEDSGKAAALVMELARVLSLTPSLLCALPTAMTTPSHCRGIFDYMVLARAQEEFEQCQASLAERIAREAPAREARTLERMKAASALKAAEQAEVAGQAALEQAEAALETAAAAEQVAAAAGPKLELELTGQRQQLERAESALEDLRRGPLAAFKALVQRGPEGVLLADRDAAVEIPAALMGEAGELGGQSCI